MTSVTRLHRQGSLSGPIRGLGKAAVWLALAILIAGEADAACAGTSSCTNALDTTAEIQQAMLNAAPGAVILVAPGVYVGNRSTSGDSGGKGLFYSGRSGTAASPIVLRSCDPSRPAVFTGTSVSDGSYGIHLTGDHWQIRDLIVTRAEKGIVIDNGNHNLLSGLEVHEIGEEAVHIRDGSSWNTLEGSKIRDTGRYRAGYGEGVYVGSDYLATFEHNVVGNVIRSTEFAGGITAEHIDIKEGADQTVVEYCTFDGTGISGANYADSFVDVKGVNSVVRFNQGTRNDNAAVQDAFQVHAHGTGYPTGVNNTFHDNTLDMDNSSGLVIYAAGGTTGTTARDNVRIGGGKLYSTNVTILAGVGMQESEPTPSFDVSVVPGPGRSVTFHYRVDRTGQGTLGVFDVAGRRVAELARGRFDAGGHELTWDPRTHGGPAGAGIYFVRLTLDGREVVRRFALR